MIKYKIDFHRFDFLFSPVYVEIFIVILGTGSFDIPVGNVVDPVICSSTIIEYFGTERGLGDGSVEKITNGVSVYPEDTASCRSVQVGLVFERC